MCTLHIVMLSTLFFCTHNMLHCNVKGGQGGGEERRGIAF